MIHHSVCPVCSSENIKLVFRVTDHFISKEEFPVFACQDCTFSFTQDYPEENAIGSYYESEKYISHSDTSASFSDKLYRFARNLMLRKKKKLVIDKTSLSSGRLLDVGSGTGYFANTMEKAGWQVKGIEISEKARNFSVSNFGLQVISPDQISTLESDSFDCITLWHVLEHFHDPFQYTSELLRLLKKDGICIIALPNSASFDAKHYGKYWAALDVPRHLWHFEPSAFTLFGEKTGLIIKEIRNLPLDVFYISILSEKYKGSGMPFLSGMIKGAWFSVKTLFNEGRNSSLVYILRKK